MLSDLEFALQTLNGSRAWWFQGLGSWALGEGFRVWDLGLGGFRVWGLGSSDWGPGRTWRGANS